MKAEESNRSSCNLARSFRDWAENWIQMSGFVFSQSDHHYFNLAYWHVEVDYAKLSRVMCTVYNSFIWEHKILTVQDPSVCLALLLGWVLIFAYTWVQRTLVRCDKEDIIQNVILFACSRQNGDGIHLELFLRIWRIAAFTLQRPGVLWGIAKGWRISHRILFTTWAVTSDRWLVSTESRRTQMVKTMKLREHWGICAFVQSAFCSFHLWEGIIIKF